MPENPSLKSVMLIDDDEIAIYLVKRTISATGLASNIVVHTDAQSALEYLIANKDYKEKMPDVIFLDINMPLMSGWKFLDLFSECQFSFRPPVYMLSSSDSVADKIKSTQYPGIVKGYFNKPLKPENVYALMQFIDAEK